MKYYDGIDEIIGNTPLLKLNGIISEYGLTANLYAKLEYLNPTGSVKDRAALYMFEQAIKQGKLKQGGTIIEPTSGNTGIGLAALGAKRGFRVILTMPETMSVERRNLLKAYGAEVVLTDGKKGMAGAIEKAEQLNAEIDGSFIPAQFDNPANPLAHYDTTSREIFDSLDGVVHAFVAGVGTGGTLCGTAKFLKEQIPTVKVYAVEPFSSQVIKTGVAGAHKIQGIGANFLPKNYDASVVDEVISATDDKAFELAKAVAKREGIIVGISSGAALSVAVELAKKCEYKGKNIVVIFPDSGDRYFSTELFN